MEKLAPQSAYKEKDPTVTKKPECGQLVFCEEEGLDEEGA